MQGERAFRFGIFELDLQARELRRRGVGVKLQEKPFQILEMLVERAGEVVPRKDLRQKLWPDTFVGFDRSLNTAVNSLRRALGDLPGNPRFLETRSRQGYRFIAPVEAIDRTPARDSEDAALQSIAVLPFRNVSGDSEMDYLSDGISETLINKLSLLPDFRVMARSTVFRYKGRDVDPQMAAHELNVRAVLTGSVMQHAETLAIGAELVDGSKGWRLWGEQYRVAFTDIFAVQDEISREITEKLRLRLTEEARRRVARRYTADPEAYRDYLRGMYHGNKMTEDGLKKGIAHFEQAIQRDPHFALPYAGLSDFYSLFVYFGNYASSEVMPKAEQAARKALEIDQALGEVHVSLAGILKSYHRDWPGAEREYNKAIELNPNYAKGHQWYADFLSSQKRTDEAILEMERALELEPLSLVISMEMAWILYMAHEYERAIDQALRTLEIEPRFSPAHHVLGLANEQMGKQEDAIRSCQKAHTGSGGNPMSLAALGHAYATAGRTLEARKILNELRSRAKRGYVSPYALAIVCAGLGNHSQSLACLQQGFDERDVWLIWIQTDPRLDCLRREPAFQNLQHQMNLTASQNPGIAKPASGN